MKGAQGGVEAFGGSLFVTFSLTGVPDVRLGVELTEVADVEDGKDGEKLNVGKEPLLIGSEMLGRTGTTATSSSSGGLVEGRAVVRSLLILPPPELRLVAGVLDRGYAGSLKLLVL